MSADTVNLVTYFDDNCVNAFLVMVRSARRSLQGGSRLRVFAISRCGERARTLIQEKAPGVDLEWIEPAREIDKVFLSYGGVSVSSWYRLLLGSCLPEEVSKVISIDCDVLVQADLTDLWRQEFEEGKIVMAVRDPLVEVAENTGSDVFYQRGVSARAPYFNAGLLVVDLSAWRKQQVEIDLHEIAASGAYFRYAEQCVLNAALAGRWQELDWSWNCQSGHVYQVRFTRDNLKQRARILHFSGRVKPWNRLCAHPMTDDYLVEWREVTASVPVRKRFLGRVLDTARIVREGAFRRDRVSVRSLRSILWSRLSRSPLQDCFGIVMGVLWLISDFFGGGHRLITVPLIRKGYL